MGQVQVCDLDALEAFHAFCEQRHEEYAHLRFGRFEIMGGESAVQAEHGGTRVFWLYSGKGEVYLPDGFRSKEGDGHPLPEAYWPDPMDPAFAARLDFLKGHFNDICSAARPPVASILARWNRDAYIGDYAHDLWKLEQTPRPWSHDTEVLDTIDVLFRIYREQGYSTKTGGSFEPIQEGDQLIVSGDERLRVRGAFKCLTLEHTKRGSSPIPAAMRLRYLRDSSGGCNVDFDPFRRLPLTWYVNLPGETGDGVNFVNAHVVNIAQETSPTHFHPSHPIGGGDPQNELYLVLDPQAYGLNTYGREACLVAYPDLSNLTRYEKYALRPGQLVLIPKGTGHRGVDVFVNVITIPGFKPHNEYYLDHQINEVTQGAAPCNPVAFDLRNYDQLQELI